MPIYIIPYICSRLYNEKGEIHREDGPAVEWSDGLKQWYRNGKVHRLDGPAVISSSGESWFINGIWIPVNSQEEFERYLKLLAFI